MKNIPRKHHEKLMPQGIINGKSSLPSFNISKQNEPLSADRFNEDFPASKKQKKTNNSLSVSEGSKGLPSFLSHRENRETASNSEHKSGALDTNALLARMGYGGMQPPGGHNMALSLLSSQREAHSKIQKTSFGGLSELFTKSSIQEENDFGLWSLGKEQLLQRFLGKAYQNTRKRAELINGSDRFPGDIKKKMEHWNQISGLIDSDIEERLHGMSEIGGIAEKYVELNSYMIGLIKSIYSLFSAALDEQELWKDRMNATEARLQIINLQKDQISEMLKEKNEILKKFIEMGGNADEFKSKKEKRENYITFENSKLASENQQLAEKLRVLESGSDITQLRQQVQSLKAESQASNAKITKELEIKEKEIQKRKLQLSSLQGSLAKLDLESRQMRVRIDEQETELIKLRSQNVEYQVKYDQFREKALMGLEDYQGMIIKTSEQRVQLNQLRDKSAALKSKLDKFTIERSKEVEIPNDGTFQNDQNMLKVLQNELGRDRSYYKMLLVSSAKLRNQEAKADATRVKYYEILQLFADKGDAAQSQQDKKEEITLSGLQMYMPNFYLLVEVAAKNYELDIQNISSRKVSTAFVGSMRGILDSKYNELLIYGEQYPKMVSKFADFVYSWLGKFTIDTITRQIRLLQETEKTQVDDTRVIFLLDLTNPKLHGIWEVVTFKEFLSEEASMDEVFFYLHCRNILFKGPNLLRYESTFDVYQYIPADQSEQMIDLMMIKFDPVNVMLVKKQLKEKIKVKNEKELIEGGFILRVLLEFYRLEKKNRYKLLKEAFIANSAMGSSGKFSISFPAFKKILMVNFAESTETEVSQLYREAYSIGQGSVTIDIFYAAANDSNYFLKYLQLNSHVKIPQLDQKGDIVDDDQNMQFRYFYNIMDQLKQYQGIIQNEALQLGIEKLYNDVDDIKWQIDNKFQVDPTDLKGRPFFLQVQRIVQTWYLIKNMQAFQLHLLPPSLNCGFETSNMILKDFDTLNRLLSELEAYSYHKKIQALERNNKFRKVQKICRAKISKFYSFVASLLSAKLKASVKDKEAKGGKPELNQPQPIAVGDKKPAAQPPKK